MIHQRHRQTDGQTDVWTDDMRQQDRALHCSALRGKNHGLGQYGAEPHYSTLPFWQLCALKDALLHMKRDEHVR